MSEPSVPFWKSGTFWSLVIAALGQIIQAALGPDGAAQRFFAEPVAPQAFEAGGELATWSGLAAAFIRRAVATRPWRF